MDGKREMLPVTAGNRWRYQINGRFWKRSVYVKYLNRVEMAVLACTEGLRRMQWVTKLAVSSTD